MPKLLRFAEREIYTILVKQKILKYMILFVRRWSLKLSCRVFKYLIKCTLQTLFVLQLVRIHHACVSFVWKLFKNFSSHCILNAGKRLGKKRTEPNKNYFNFVWHAIEIANVNQNLNSIFVIYRVGTWSTEWKIPFVYIAYSY